MQHVQPDDQRLRTFASALNREMVAFVMSMDTKAPNTRALRNALLEATLNVDIDVSEVRCKQLAARHDGALRHVRTMLDELSSLLYAVFQRRLMSAPIYAQFKLVIMQMKFLLPHSEHELDAHYVADVVHHAERRAHLG